MGNYVSCTLSGPAGKQSRCAKVIYPGGEVQQFSTPTKAAELMLERPNFFLVNSRSLHVGRRFSALNADEDLEMGNVYIMFPMKKLNSMVAAADMGAMFFVAKRVTGGKVRILPEVTETLSAPSSPSEMVDDRSVTASPNYKLNLDEIEGYSSAEIKHRLSMSRSRKPLLETIAEEPYGPRPRNRHQHSSYSPLMLVKKNSKISMPISC